MTIYIASSWKNQHAVEMLTQTLRLRGHEVLSFIENNHGEDYKNLSLDAWIESDEGTRAFDYDTHGAMHADLVIYVGPSGPDAWAEIGAAYARRRSILGLWSKGEPIGLMRRMVGDWFTNYRDLLDFLDNFVEAVYGEEPLPDLKSALVA